MIIAVTGGAGQLGGAVLQRLAADRKVKEVRCLDLRPPAFVSGRLRHAIVDIRDPGIAAHFDGCDAVVHLAFLVGDFRPRAEYDAINVGGSENVFRAAAAARVGRIVYASSLAAYGVVPGHPVPIVEDTPRRHQPSFPYASAKWRVEDFLDRFEREHPELAIARMRPGILIGARMENPLGVL